MQRRVATVQMWGHEFELWDRIALSLRYPRNTYMHACMLVGLRTMYEREGNLVLARYCDEHLVAEKLDEFTRKADRRRDGPRVVLRDMEAPGGHGREDAV